jgi:phosphoribosylglycinamide formyltransferase 1
MRVAVLISGRGSNMVALIEASKDDDFPAQIVCVISNKADASGLERAARHGIPTRVIAHKSFPSREAHDAALNAAFEALNPDIVCLAGYMRIMTADLIERWQGRMINIHPSLLPAFPGLATHQRAIDAGVAEHGCTVHFVTLGVDEGPIIAQAKVPVLPGDTAETLASRVLVAEHQLYPAALRLVAEGNLSPHLLPEKQKIIPQMNQSIPS